MSQENYQTKLVQTDRKRPKISMTEMKSGISPTHGVLRKKIELTEIQICATKTSPFIAYEGILNKKEGS